MFGKGFELFKLFGFSVKVDWSWVIIFVLITWSLATGAFPHFLPDLQPATYLWMGLSGAIGLFISIVLHELAHSLVARRYGVDMRGITLFIFGGVAEMKDEPPSATAEFMIAIAGPIASVLIGAGCLAAGLAGGAAAMPPSVYGVLMYLGFINLLLVGFNLIPAFPLDGGRALRAILWGIKGNLKWATRITAALGSVFAFVLMALGVVRFIAGDFVGGIWSLLLGMFLHSAAQMSYQQLLVRRALEGEPIRRFMQSDVHTVPPSVSVEQFVDDYVYKYHHKMFPVAENGALQGCVTTNKLKELPRDEWPRHTIAELADACGDENTIDINADATSALTKMSQNGNSRLIVVENGQLRGVVGLKDMMKFISLKVELEQD